MKEKIRKIAKRKILLLFSAAIILAMFMTAFPIHIEQASDNVLEGSVVIRIGKGNTQISIGNKVLADVADYTCDGTADDVQFQAAVDALPASAGQLWVESGTYNFAALSTVTRVIDNVSIIGVGGGVYFNTDDVTAAFTAGGNNWLFSNLQVDAGGIDMGATTDWMWLNAEVDSVYYSLRTDSINIEDHSALHGSGGADAIKIDDLASADDNTDLDASVAAHGLLPKLGGGTTNFFRADGAWAIPSGGGDVSGPSSSTDNMIARHDGVGGKTIQDYTSNPPTISDSGDMNIDGDLDLDNIVVSGDVDGVDVSVHDAADTGVHGVGAETILHTGDVGSSLQAWDTDLDDIAALTDTDSNFIVGDGSNWVAESGATVRTSLGLVIGTDVQAWDTELDDIAALSDADSNFIVGSAGGWVAESAATVRTSLGLAIGTNVQAWDDDLDDLAGLTPTDSNFIVGDGSDWVSETGATARASLGLTIGTDVLAEQTIGIADDNLLEVDGSPNDDEVAYFTANGLEGLTEAEFKAAFNLVIGTDVLAEQTIGIADDNLLEVDGSPNDDEVAYFTANGLEGLTEAEFQAAFNLQIGTDVLAEQTIGIADDNLLEVDDADAADNDYAKFTVNGLEGRDYDEVRTDLEVPDTTTAAVTLYVDAGSGSDSNAGTSGSPKETIQGALDALPVVIANSCTVKVRGQQNYAESNVALDFSRFNTLETITIEVVNANDEDMFDNGLATGGGNDDLDDSGASWAADQFNDAYLMIYAGTGRGQIREILDTESTRIEISTGATNWATNPDNTSYYAVIGGATLTGTGGNHVTISGKRVAFYGFRHTGATAYDIYSQDSAIIRAYYGYHESGVRGVFCNTGTFGNAYYNWYDGTTNGAVAQSATLYPRASVFNGMSTGCLSNYGGLVVMYAYGGSYVNYFNSCTTGSSAAVGSGSVAATVQVYLGCTADHSTDATSWET